MLEEGGNSPADIFFSQDAGALGAVASKGRLRVLPGSTLRRVSPRFRAPGKRWVGVSGRARVVAYNTDALRARDLPKTIWGYTQTRWRGKVGVPPTNASFQAFVTAMRMRVGNDRTRDWLLALKANDVKFFPSNSRILDAVASREIEVGLVNHYYLYQLMEQRPTAPVANHFLSGKNDPGALVNVAGVGVVTSTKKRTAALRLVNFLLGKDAQRFFARSPGRAEYPLAAGIRPRPGLPSLSRIEGAGVKLGSLGFALPKTLELLAEVGYTR
jgi:iron(III) transport system substrate-binding protein